MTSEKDSFEIQPLTPAASPTSQLDDVTVPMIDDDVIWRYVDSTIRDVIAHSPDVTTSSDRIIDGDGSKMVPKPEVKASDVTIEFDDVKGKCSKVQHDSVAAGSPLVGSAGGDMASLKVKVEKVGKVVPQIAEVSVAAVVNAQEAPKIGNVLKEDATTTETEQKKVLNTSYEGVVTPTKGQGQVSGGSRSATPTSAKKGRTSRGWSTWESKEPVTPMGEQLGTPVTSHARKDDSYESRTPVVDVGSITRAANALENSGGLRPVLGGGSRSNNSTPQKSGSDVTKMHRKSLTPAPVAAVTPTVSCSLTADRNDVMMSDNQNKQHKMSAFVTPNSSSSSIGSNKTPNKAEKSPEKRRRLPEGRSRRIGSGRCVTPTDIDVAGVSQFMASSAGYTAKPRAKEPVEEKEVLLELTFNLSEFPDSVSPHGSPGKSGKGRGGGSSRSSLNSQDEFCPDLIIPPDFPVDLYSDELQAVCTEEELARYGLNKTGPIGKLRIPPEYRRMFAYSDFDGGDMSGFEDGASFPGEDGSLEDLWMHCGGCCKYSGDLFDSGFLSPADDTQSETSAGTGGATSDRGGGQHSPTKQEMPGASIRQITSTSGRSSRS